MKIRENSLIPNREYLEMNCVAETPTGRGLNTCFIMENIHDGTFKITDGRVGIRVGPHKPKQYVMPIEKWDEIYLQKVNRGYILTKKEKMDKKIISQNEISFGGKSFKALTDIAVDDIIQRLITCTNEMLSDTYTIKVDDISDEMLDKGKSLLDEIAVNYENMSVAEFNNKLKILFATIPRRIDNVSKILAKRKFEMNDIVAEEQELYDVMLAQLRNNKITGDSGKMTILEAFGLEWRTVTENEKIMLLEKLGPEAPGYINAWKVDNRHTKKDFTVYCEKENLTLENAGVSYLFHGSRTENFWSIITNGLTINPSNVQINGKMFGRGTYFASLSTKSLGYSSRDGSRWVNGTAHSGFLAIYSVATGKHYDIYTSDSSLNWERLQEKCPGAHCTWAHAGKQLYNDEIIVYQDFQSTIEYLIEVKA